MAYLFRFRGNDSHNVAHPRGREGAANKPRPQGQDGDVLRDPSLRAQHGPTRPGVLLLRSTATDPALRPGLAEAPGAAEPGSSCIGGRGGAEPQLGRGLLSARPLPWSLWGSAWAESSASVSHPHPSQGPRGLSNPAFPCPGVSAHPPSLLACDFKAGLIERKMMLQAGDPAAMLCPPVRARALRAPPGPGTRLSAASNGA